MQMYTKKRLELIIEKPAFKRASRILEESGVKGYTAFSAFAGYGGGRRWQRGTDLSASQDMIMIIAVMDDLTAAIVIKDLESLIGSHIGLLTMSDVTVIRDEKF
jgi:PII-like signaling protein